MRLIDADKFLERMSKDPLFPLVERYGLSGVIESEPTVEAIPVEFILKEAQFVEDLCEQAYGLPSTVANEYLMLIREWRKEKGER